jgi:hypothetical protein
MNERMKALIRNLLSMLMIALGVIFVLATAGAGGQRTKVWEDLGLALSIAGVVSFFQEAILSRFSKEDGLKLELERVRKSFSEDIQKIANSLNGPRIEMLAEQRNGYAGYHRWVLERAPQQLFFAGHSVLHHIQADFKALKLKDVEDAIAEKMSSGSKARFLFLDPTWDLFKRVAESENQTVSKMARDLRVSLEICKRLSDKLKAKDIQGEIEVKVCRELVQYAFQHTICSANHFEEMLVGFYFAGILGTQSPLLTVENRSMRDIFSKHFVNIFDRASSRQVLYYSRDGVGIFNEVLYSECLARIAELENHSRHGE